MPKRSAGLLLYRFSGRALEVLLAHPGGPFFRGKDDGVWSIPKGEPQPDENLLDAAQREVAEEIGIRPTGPFIPLPPVKQKGGKVVHAWAVAGDCDPTHLRCNTVTLEWPPRSGRRIEFPEIDRAAFFDLETARRKITPGQAALIDALEEVLGS